MPAAVFPLVTARLHGGHMPTALGVVVGTCLVGLVSIPSGSPSAFGGFCPNSLPIRASGNF